MDAELCILAEDIARDRDEAPLTRDLIRRFGGPGFIFNVRMWEGVTRNGAACCYVPADNYYRKRYEVLAQTGVAARGAATALEMRFSGIPMPALREAAKVLGAGPLRDKAAGARQVSGSPDAESWFLSRYTLDDFFLLTPEPWSYQELEALWGRCVAAARTRLLAR